MNDAEEWAKLPLVSLTDDIESRLYETLSDLEFVHSNSESVKPKAVWLLVNLLRDTADRLEKEMAQ